MSPTLRPSLRTLSFGLSSAACFLLTSLAWADEPIHPHAGMMRYPDVSQNRIVFVYGGDIWTAPHDGGMASPLASPSGQEIMPRFSPDGNTIAFSGNYGSGIDVFTLPTEGGVPQRVTFHPAAEIVCDWTSSGGLLFSTNAFAGLDRQPQLFLKPADSNIPTKLAVPYGTNGALDKEGSWLAYTPHSHDERTWKRYRGGMASNVWLFNLKTMQSQQMTDWEGTDSFPMWQGDQVYYLSDQGPEHRLNIWVYETATKNRHQVTKFDAFDCKSPAIGPGDKGQGEIVLQNGSTLWLVDLSNESNRSIDITIPGDRPAIAPRKVDFAKFAQAWDISPSGKRVVAEARGDIWTLPANQGSARNLTRTSGVAERTPSWSPDGRWIAYFSDATGEYELYCQQSDGRGETRQLTQDGTCFRISPTWSPDSKRIAFTDKTGTIWLHTLETKSTVKVDVDPHDNIPSVSWSQDSAWITYARSVDGRLPANAIWVYNVTDATRHQLTSGFFNDKLPVFDRKGEYIYFASARNFSAPKYEDVGTSFIYSETELLLALPLRDAVVSPLLPKSDEETWKDESKAKDAAACDAEKKSNGSPSDKSDASSSAPDKKDGEPKKEGTEDAAKEPSSDGDKSDGATAKKGDEPQDKDADKEAKPVEPVKIDLERTEQRVFVLPAKAGNFSAIGVNDKNQIVYARAAAPGSEGPGSIKLLDLCDDKHEELTVIDGAGAFGTSADGKKLLVLAPEGRVFVIDAAVGQKLEKSVPTEGMIATVDPRSEWKQVFNESWRVERDYFYDPNMHHVDWKSIRDQYAKMLDDCTSRYDVSFVIGEMISELNVGHAYYRPTPEEMATPSSDVGLLGCRFESLEGAQRIAEFYEGAAWDSDARNLLRQAGVKEGNFVLAVNGIPMAVDESPYKAMQGTAGQTVTLTVSTDAKLSDDDKQIVVKAMASDSELRFRAWIEHNRKFVDDKSGGKIGYIYVVNTGVPGQNDLFRQYYGQLNKEALIIDDRWNGGGQIPTRFIELLNRPVTNYWAKRDGRDMTWPPDSHQGPKCMLTNGMAGSGGDMFPALFKQAGVGKVIGTRTWGGLVGISGNPGNIDGSSVTAPTFAYYEKDGTWGVEGHGVDPDIEVVDDPSLMINGGDPQLDRAIAILTQELQSQPYKMPARPAYPDRSKMGLKDEDK